MPVRCDVPSCKPVPARGRAFARNAGNNPALGVEYLYSDRGRPAQEIADLAAHEDAVISGAPDERTAPRIGLCKATTGVTAPVVNFAVPPPSPAAVAVTVTVPESKVERTAIFTHAALGKHVRIAGIGAGILIGAAAIMQGPETLKLI